MQYTKFLRRFFLINLFLVTMQMQVAAEQEEMFHPFKPTFTEISPGIWTSIRNKPHLHPVMGNSVIVVGSKSVVVFDGGGVAAMTEQLITKIRSVTDAPVSHVVISHWHGDHNFGIYRFKEEFPNVQIVTQEFTDRALRNEKMNYLDSYPDYLQKTIPRIEKRLAEALNDIDDPEREFNKIEYQRILEHKNIVAHEFKRAKLPLPTLVFDRKLIIRQGSREIQLLRLGHGNTEGDIVMWLPREKIVATGDLVVLPTPYAFNVPPRAWAETLNLLNQLNYKLLVPGHGRVQKDTTYVDLVIKAATYIADQRDQLVAKGVATKVISNYLSLDKFRSAFIQEDESLRPFYRGYFADPLIAAAIKELSGEPMVELIPKSDDNMLNKTE